MTTFAGLFVEVGANIASFVSGMTKLEVLSAKTSKKIARDFDKIGSQLAGAIGVSAFTYLVKGSIDAMDKLNDLSKSTMLSVETLGALGITAAQTGSDLAGMAQGINKLGQNIGKESERFAALGITAKDPLEAFKQLADVFSQIEDPQLRAAVASEALGKSWQSLAPLLAQGSKGIEDSIRANKEWAVVTAETAKQADELNDKLAIFFKSGAAMASIVGPALPVLNKLADELLSVAKASLKARGEVDVLGTGIKIIVVGFAEIIWWVKAAGETLGNWAARLSLVSDAFAKMKLGDYSGALESLSMANSATGDLTETLKQSRAEHDKWVMGVLKAGTAAYGTAFAVDDLAATYEDAAKRGGKSINDVAKNFLNFGKNTADAKKEAEDFAKLMDKLFGEEHGFKPDFGKNVELLNNALAKGTLTAAKHEQAMAALVKMQPRYTDGLKATTEQLERLERAMVDGDRAMEDLKKTYDDAGRAFNDTIKSLEEEYKMLGMSNAQRVVYIELLKLQKAGHDITSASVQDMAQQMAGLVLAMESVHNTRRMWDELGDRIATIAVEFAASWKKGFEAVKQMGKRLAQDLLAFFAKKWVLQIGASMVGGTAGAAMANDAANLGQGTVTGAMGNWLGGATGTAANWLTGTTGGWAGIGADIAVGFNAGLEGTAIASLEGASIATEFGALLANPATWVVMAAIIAWAVVRSREGGPKEGGSFTGMFDAQGNFIGSGSALGTDNGRLFTPSGQDNAMEAMTRSFAQGFYSTLRRMGGTSAGMGFSMGVDQDPKGSAANRVMAQIQRDGEIIWQQMIEAGRDNEDLQRGFAQQMSRMMLAGLQQSNLPHGLARILNTVSASMGSTEEINAIIALAVAFGDLMNVITAPFTAGGVIEAGTRTAVDLLGMQGDALLDLADNTDMTVEELNTLTAATAAYRQSAAQLVLVYYQLQKASDELFDGLIEQTDLAGMSQQQQFAYWQQKAQELFEAMLASSDPAEIERLMGQFQTAWSNAWNMLTPEQQATEGASWGERLRQARDMVNQHLQDLINETVTETNNVLEVVGDKMDAAADKFAAAATTQDKAATTFAKTVSEGIDVNVTLGAPATEVGGGN